MARRTSLKEGCRCLKLWVLTMEPGLKAGRKSWKLLLGKFYTEPAADEPKDYRYHELISSFMISFKSSMHFFFFTIVTWTRSFRGHYYLMKYLNIHSPWVTFWIIAESTRFLFFKKFLNHLMEANLQVNINIIKCLRCCDSSRCGIILGA